MKVTRQQAAANRERVIDVASRLFRERGLAGVGVADLMNDAGLTHGGFYGHFESKEALMAQACERALEASIARWNRLGAPGEGDALHAIARDYLSKRHRDGAGAGCVIPSLAVEASRHGAGVRRAITDGIRALADVLARCAPGKSKVERRRRALVHFSQLVGAVVLARAVDDAKLSDEILGAVLASIEASVA